MDGDEMSNDQPGPRRPPARWHKILGVGASFVLLIFILVGVIPRFASYSGAWADLTQLNVWWWVAIAVAAAINQISGVWPYQAALPGLRTQDGFVLIETSAAISNTVPAGGAVAIGMTYRMLSSFGFSGVDISTAVITTGIWNVAAKLGLPLAAVGLLSITSHSTATVRGAALAGVVALLIAAALLWVLFRSASGAQRIGRLTDRAVNRVGGIFRRPATDRVERSIVGFKTQTVRTMHSRGWLLTWTTLANQLAGFLLVLIIVRAIGIRSGEVTLIAVFTSFAIARLAGAIPVTPGGLGTLDATFVSLMTTFGTSSSRALAVDLVWRLMVYFLPILPGIVTYLIWIRTLGGSARRHVLAAE
jgi:putative heme transporter